MRAPTDRNANRRRAVTDTYLDWAATAPLRPEALTALTEAAAAWANPSSVHGAGRGAAALLDAARRELAAALDRPAASIVLTGGGTEALGLALAQADAHLISAVEHDAVRAQVPRAGVVPVDRDGIVDLAALDQMLAVAPRSPLVAVMHVNNETGVIQPVAEVARIVAARGGRLLIDAVQSAGKLPLPDADFVAVSAHKLGGPPGVGALIVREPVAPVQRGGGQERGQRAGTENLPGIAAFAAAATAAAADSGWLDRVTALRDRLEAALRVCFGSALPGAVVHGGGAARIGTIACLGLPGVAAMTQLMTLDIAGFAVSAGAACSSGKVRTSHVLGAMAVDGAAAAQAIRVSFGWTTTAAEVDAFAVAWRAMAVRLGAR